MEGVGWCAELLSQEGNDDTCGDQVREDEDSFGCASIGRTNGGMSDKAVPTKATMTKRPGLRSRRASAPPMRPTRRRSQTFGPGLRSVAIVLRPR